MPNELRKRTAFIAGTISDNPLTAAATSINSAEFANLPVIDTTNHLVLVLDPEETAGAPEIVYVTAHTGSATVVTVTRGQEGTTARQHAQNTVVRCVPTLRDWKPGAVAFARRSAGNIIINSTAWTNFQTALDLVLEAQEGDIVEVAVNTIAFNENVDGFLDVVSLVGGTPQNSWATDGAIDATGQGIVGWKGTASTWAPIGSPVMRQLVAADISGGQVTLRLRARTGTATNKTWAAASQTHFTWWAINHGPRLAL